MKYCFQHQNFSQIKIDHKEAFSHFSPHSRFKRHQYVYENHTYCSNSRLISSLRHRPAALTEGSKRSLPVLVDTQLSKDDIEDRINHAANVIATSEKLLVYDTENTNIGLVVWQAIRDIPPDNRPSLIQRLSSADIRRLWNVSGQRFNASSSALIASIGPDFSVWNDLPSTTTEIVYFKGKAALPLHTLGVSSFEKAFFISDTENDSAVGDGHDGNTIKNDPKSKTNNTANFRDDDDKHGLFGRVIHPTVVANRLYPGPMYFMVTDIGKVVVPALYELCDMKLEYPENQGNIPGLQGIPRSAWPRPGGMLRAPFNKSFTDYIRVAGPGVYVGMGYRTEGHGSGVPLIPSPLYFIMAKSKMDDLREY